MTLDWRETPPSAAAYVALRAAAGLSPKSEAAAEQGLRGTIYGVSGWGEGSLVAMARLVGDGGCHVLLVDVAVRPAFQGQGHGTEAVDRVMTWARRELPTGCYVSLLADPGAEGLYARAGFEPMTGMGQRL